MQKEIRIDLFTSVSLLSILFFYIAVSLLSVPLIPVAGKYTFLLFMFLILLVLIQKKNLTKSELILFAPFLTLNFVYLFSATDFDGIMIFINQTAYIMVIYIIYSISWTKTQIHAMSYLYYLSLPIIILLIFIVPGLLNSNVIGSYAYLIAFFPLLYLIGYSKNLKKSRILLIFSLMLFTIIATDTRSVLLSIFFGFVTFILWKLITTRKVIFNLYFFSILAINYFIVVVYPNMYKWDNFYQLNELSLNLTGKPIMTGRNTIWAQLVDIISLKPWTGYGSSVVPEDFLSTSLSAHNMYLQIALQTGVIGIVLLLIFFYFIWKAFWKNRQDTRVTLSASFLVSILIHQSFEVTLTQNQFGIGLLQWIIIAFGLNYALNKNKQTETEPK